MQRDMQQDSATNHVSKASSARLSPGDPFQRLPPEIMIQIWSNINVLDLLRSCVMVSRTWRDQLLQCGYLWTKVTVHQEDHLSPIALSTVSDHVQRLRLFYLSSRWLTGFHTKIMQGSFASITHLTIMLGKISSHSSTSSSMDLNGLHRRPRAYGKAVAGSNV